MTEGHTWLSDVLGVRPRTSWSNDPFGYSASQPYLLRHLGFSHMLIQRVHYEVKKALALDHSLEFLWRQQWEGAPQAQAKGQRDGQQNPLAGRQAAGLHVSYIVSE